MEATAQVDNTCNFSGTQLLCFLPHTLRNTDFLLYLSQGIVLWITWLQKTTNINDTDNRIQCL